ncbi:hypothetical protein AAK899_07995 [Erysipelotrichaceae bacterium 51-3]|uniref:hypothetical protein n=1 Tax=Allobaculum sp. JKK-2023 TaxID=3108943 RepID=UPI002B05E4DA|nr:hypothetical protein [Allobaculum sp. JKK-2023]
MSDGLKRIIKDSFYITLALDAVLLVVFWLLWPVSKRTLACLGVVYGSAVAMAGLVMICSMVNGLTVSVQKGKSKGRTGYYLRYAFYAVCLGLGAWLMKFSVLAMLAGIIAQKASLVLYSLKQRKDRK